VFDFPLQQGDFCGSQVEQFVDAGVDFGFGLGELLGEGLDGGTLFGEVGFPLVGGLGFLERVGLELEAGLQGVAEFVQGLFPPSLRFVVQRVERLALRILAERLAQAALEVRLQFVALRSQRRARFGQLRDGLTIRDDERRDDAGQARFGLSRKRAYDSAMTDSVHTTRYHRFRDVLTKARQAQGLSQEALAEKLGCVQTFVSKYERGERRLDVVEFLDVADALGIDPGKVIRQLQATND